MNIKKLFFRDKQEKSVDVVECWEVRWMSRHGETSCNVAPEANLFLSEEEAETFAKALEDAYRLIKHTSGNQVQVSKQ